MKETSVFKNIIYNFILTIFNLVIPIITSGYVARVLSVETYSLYNVATNNLQIFIILGALGIATYGVRQMGLVHESKPEKDKLFSELFIVNLVSSLFVFALAIIASFYMEDTRIAFLIMTLQLLAEIFNLDWIKTSKEDFKFITIKTIIIKSLYVVYLFSFVKNPDDLILYTIGAIGTNIINMVASTFFIKKDVRLIFGGLDIKRHIKPLLILTMSSNVAVLYATLDKKFLEYFDSYEAVTYYSMAVLLVNMIAALVYPIRQSATPRLSKLIKSNFTGYIDLLIITFDSYFFLVFPALLGCIVMARDVIVVFATEKYLLVVLPMMLYAVAKIFIEIISFLSTNVMYFFNREMVSLKYNLIIGISNFVGNMILVLLGVFSIHSTLILTIILETVMLFLMYRYVNLNLLNRIKLLKLKHLEILIISLVFIPISLFIRSFELSIYINIFVIPIVCVIAYFGYFTLRKSEFVAIYYEKINHILKINK